MKTSLHIKTVFHTDAGRQDWWPLEMLAGAARSAVMLTAKHGRAFARPDSLMPGFRIDSLDDLELLAPHGEHLLALLKSKAQGVLETLTMPGLLDRRPDCHATFDVLFAAADQLQEAATTARQIAGACVTSVSCEAGVMRAWPGLASLVLAWNSLLADAAESYVRFVEAIPDELERILAVVRAGESADFMLKFNMSLDTSAAHEALMQIKADQELTVEAGGCTGTRAGKVYALINPSMPGLVKIGKTTRNSERRAGELDTTGVPTPFTVLYEADVVDCHEAERQVHAALASFRVSGRREFFRVEPRHAVAALFALSAGESG